VIEDGGTDQGTVTTVQPVGDTIRRPPGRLTPLVHPLPVHLEAAGFPAAGAVERRPQARAAQPLPTYGRAAGTGPGHTPPVNA
jgi:hypothetical protein